MLLKKWGEFWGNKTVWMDRENFAWMMDVVENSSNFDQMVVAHCARRLLTAKTCTAKSKHRRLILCEIESRSIHASQLLVVERLERISSSKSFDII